MYLMYADEFGHDGIWNPADPRHSHHPLFGLAGFVLQARRWADLDRGYHRLKRNFYAPEIRRDGVRSERFEPKNLSLGNRRDVRFTHGVFDMLDQLKAVVFAYGLKKPVAAPTHNSPALYGSVTQGLMRAYEKFARDQSGQASKALMVIDRRQEARDVEVLASAQSYLFSAAPTVPGGFGRVIEAPMLVRSEWHHGIQVSDNICRVIGRVFRFRVTGDVTSQPFDAAFGPRIDRLTHQIAPNWRSVYVRP